VSETGQRREPDEEPQRHGIVIGGMSGGAVAQGRGSTAEDRSRRPHPAAPAPVPPMPAAPPPGTGGIVIASLSGGAVAQGEDSRAVDASVTMPPAEAERLLTAVRQLRRELLGEPPTDETAELDRELAQVTEEVRRTGRADRSRLTRLRERLEVGALAAAAGASAAAVAQAIAQLLG
jgi:hypothetical protein